MKELTFILGILLAHIFSAATMGQTTKPVLLDNLIQEVLQNNPQLQAARHQTEAARAQIRQATAWDAPQIGIEFFQTPVKSFPNPIADGMETDYFIQQMFPIPGKLSAMGRAAKNKTNIMEQGYKALEKKIIYDLKSAFFELYLIQRKIQINQENQEWMRKFSDIATRQYEVGMGNQADILRAQTELSTLINQGLNLQQEKKSSEAMINTLTNRPVDQPLGFIADIEAKLPVWTFQQLKPIALKNRAELLAMGFDIQMNKAELTSAKREYYPDIMFRVMYKDMAMTSNDFWSTMIGLNVPFAFWSSAKYTQKVQENKLNLKVSEKNYQNMVNMVQFELQDALVRVQTNQNLLNLHQYTVIPQAEQTLQSTLSAYQTGKTEFLMLIDAYRMLWMARLDYYMSIMNYMTSQAALEQAVGLSIAEITQQLQ